MKYHFARIAPLVAGAGTLLAVAASVPASAATHYPNSQTATTKLTNRLDSGGGGNWAVDTIARTVTVTNHGPVAPLNCGLLSGTCYRYTASLKDTGTFVTIEGAPRPNQGAPDAVNPIIGNHHGTVKGSGTFASFYANYLPHSGKVPTKVNGNGDSTSLWPELFFPGSTTFAGLDTSLQTWGWNYATISKTPQHWADTSANVDGQLPADGDIG
jgi:hypothetical protein